MKPSDLNLLHSVSVPTIHPDGTRAVVSATRPDFAADAYVGQLWSVPLGGGTPRRITQGFADTQPRFSPDGEVLGFLRSVPGGKPQLYAVPAAGGEPVRLTDSKMGVSWFRFSPDSAQLVFSSRVPAHGRYGTVDGVGPGAEDPRLISSYKYRANGAGYTADKRVQVFLLDLPALDAEPWIAPVGRAKEASGQAGDSADGGIGGGFPEARQLTHADADATAPVFSADGKHVLFTVALHSGADEDLVSDIYALALTGTEPERLTNTAVESETLLGVSEPTPSADGQWLYFLAQDLSGTGKDFVARNTALYVLPAGSDGPARRLTDPEDTDLAEGGIVPAGESEVLVFNRTRGSVELLQIDAGGERRVLASGPLVVQGAAAAAGAVVVSYADGTTMGEAALLEAGGLRPLTDFSAQLRKDTRVAPALEEIHPSRDGYPVHGWVVLPEGPGPHPVLLNIHGGPFAQFDCAYFDEAQAYAAAGYAVVQCNPRGSAGYGQAHGRVIKEAMGTRDLDDVLAFLEGVLAAHPELDGARLGVMGGSYGGYLSAWTTANDHRFTAAIVERGFLDPLSFTGSADIGWFFGPEYTGTNTDQVLAQSPMARVGDVRTPTLVIHSEEDLRCPVEQAQRYYTALKQHGVPAELLLFPGENHELSRAGTPWHRRQRFEHVLRWWEQWLKPGNA
ncbi:S9 family peptidase [Arthrobacter sp. zg-Y820]|uniref:S9 family peptidase n=1 Tax=unclassified Arthrobacter TaxID=235627 RepID=UPI0025422012|nr:MULTISPECIES: S9 family peptidase [unclassified Arthrobacter]MCC9196703.1 S9 family peptidase [Arthrobacter sp. zg-Y820]MDK1279565.1 S9 family peptidase [Arthrobacter sp. zg.Y820]WIB08061.1 S9 family peptidase [Arthrobacter sp. zg-Y820]